MALKAGTVAAVGGGGKGGVFDGEACACLVRELRQSFESGRTRSYEWRKQQLRMVLKFLVEKEALIVQALHRDLRKPGFEACVSEISMLKSSCKLILKKLKRWMEPQKACVSITSIPGSAEIISEPLGVVLVISAWNYPFLLAMDPVLGAIAAGNAVVLKPSEVSPSTSSLLASLVSDYLDNSAIKVVEGAVDETTMLLEQKWDKIFYTGCTRVGRVVMTAAAKHLTPVVLELGGKCPLVIDSKTDLKVTSKRVAVGKWGSNNGQACVAPDYIITTKSFAPKLIESLKQTLTSFFGDKPLLSPDLSRIVNTNHFSRLTKLLDDQRAFGKIVHGGERDEKLLMIAPTILLDVPADALMMNEEIFGPLLPIITVDKIEDSIDIIKSHPKPLAAYLFSNDKKLEKMFVKQISAGGMIVNDTVLHLTNPSLPFGGVGDSGIGAYHGKHSFDAFSHKKPVLHRCFIGEVWARYPPYNAMKLKFSSSAVAGDIFGALLSLVRCR
ncbi:aldehyde dehydrogenase family 3 member H1-like isoform X1 [Nymphaea colorata]|nr:aldehyde dehydrogenase family 3 member H1-like isoform X1 [Nymphaea colorata]